jgi:hypothetical protein
MYTKQPFGGGCAPPDSTFHHTVPERMVGLVRASAPLRQRHLWRSAATAEPARAVLRGRATRMERHDAPFDDAALIPLGSRRAT